MNLDVRYAAGLFDGEGWITICRQPIEAMGSNHRYTRNYIRFQLSIGISQVYKPVIDAWNSTFAGGNIFIKRPTIKQGPKTRISYCWKTSSGRAANVLSLLLPYLMNKREQAELALEFQKHIREHTNDFKYRPELRPELYAYRESVLAKLLELKRCEFIPPVVDDAVSDVA